jgi:hypothetical protein
VSDKNYEPTIEGHYEKCCDERDSLLLTIEELSNRIHELTAERDEARREVCQMKGTVRWNHYFPHFDPKGYAENRGWDCHKDYK